MSHYSSIFNAIAVAVKQAWDVESTSPGRSNKLNLQLPKAVITLNSVQRSLAGRSVEQSWSWSIAGLFSLPTVPGIDPQELMNNKAEALIDILTPFSELSNSIPSVPAPFGGVAYNPLVESWEPVPLDDADNAVAVNLTFSCKSTVWQ
jgi:hypothetical protein